MKKFAKASAALATLLLVANVGGMAQAAPKKLSYASHVPSTHILHTDGMQPFFEQVTTDTSGDIVFEEFSGGAMGNGKALLSIVRDGIVDSALVVYVYFKKDLPVSAAITDLGLLGGDNMVMAAASAETHLLDCPECLAEHKANNFRALSYYASAPYMMMCTKPISTLEQLQGVKIRAVGAWAIWLQNAGAVPVSIPSSEIYEALQRGQADCTIGSPAWLKQYNLADVVKYIVDIEVGVYHGALAYPVNLDTWEGLSVEQRQSMIDHAPGITRRMVMAYREETAEALNTAKEKGVQLLEPDAALLASLEQQRILELDRVAEAAKGNGVDNAKDIFDRFFGNVEKWKKIVASINADPDLYEQALTTEIYSKLQP